MRAFILGDCWLCYVLSKERGAEFFAKYDGHTRRYEYCMNEFERGGWQMSAMLRYMISNMFI